MSNAPLSGEELQSRLSSLQTWRIVDAQLVRLFVLIDFPEAIRFVNSVAHLAESVSHHPDIDIRYNKVRLALVTHDAGGITEKDFSLARRIDGLQQ